MVYFLLWGKTPTMYHFVRGLCGLQSCLGVVAKGNICVPSAKSNRLVTGCSLNSYCERSVLSLLRVFIISCNFN